MQLRSRIPLSDPTPIYRCLNPDSVLIRLPGRRDVQHGIAKVSEFADRECVPMQGGRGTPIKSQKIDDA